MAYDKKMDENIWVFTNKPTAPQIQDLLSDIPAWFGGTKMMSEYSGFVIPYSRGKEGPWRLYTTVAGKLAILRGAHTQSDGTVVPITEETEIEYKNQFVIIRGRMVSPIFGTVYEVGTGVMSDNASGADRTNPFENAMTSWRGRAASALCGAGILPYTGIASAEEVQTAQHRDEMADRGYTVVGKQEEKSDAKPARATVTEKNLESMKKAAGVDDDQLESLMGKYIQSLGDSYEGSAREYVLQQPITFANGLLQFIKGQKS